jgi:hypothetical protein
MVLAPLCLVMMSLGGKAQLVTAEERMLSNAKVDAQLHHVLGKLLTQERSHHAILASAGR